MTANRLGLGRPIPEGVKRLVRQKCGFGCAICGLGYYDYHHIIPYSISEIHNPDEIILLCAFHHTELERKRISQDKVVRASKQPFAVQQGYASGVFESSSGKILVEVGNSTFTNTPNIIRVGTIPILGFLEPEEADEPWRMTAFMTDRDGLPLLTVRNNEWKVSSNRWDVVTEGQDIIIKNARRNIGLKLKCIPGEKIIIQKMKMRFVGFDIECDGDEILIGTNSFSGIQAESCGTGIQLNVDSEMERPMENWLRSVGSRVGIDTFNPYQNLKLF